MDIFKRETNSVTLEELPLPPATQLADEPGDNAKNYWTTFEDAVNEIKRNREKKGAKKTLKRKL